MLINSKFLLMEDEVIKKIINNASEYNDVLLQQYSNILKYSREFDECGFYTNFEINKGNCTMISKNLTLNSIYGKLNDNDMEVGFLLFVRNGYISMLECYKIHSEEFPNEITKYNLYKEM